MQYQPDKAELLEAVAAFLATEARPKTSDPATSFRLLIAAHLCTTIAAEIRGEDVHDANELRGLLALLKGADEAVLPATRVARAAWIRTLNGALSARLRGGQTNAAERARIAQHLKTVLADRLSVSSPKFDLAARLPGEPEMP